MAISRCPMIPLLDQDASASGIDTAVGMSHVLASHTNRRKLNISIKPRKQSAHPRRKLLLPSFAQIFEENVEGLSLSLATGKLASLSEFSLSTPVNGRILHPNLPTPNSRNDSSLPMLPALLTPDASHKKVRRMTLKPRSRPRLHSQSAAVTAQQRVILGGANASTTSPEELMTPEAFFLTPKTPCD